MNETTTKQIERMIAAARYVASAVSHGRDVIAELDERLAELDGRTCTGTPFWRDKDHPTRSPKFYANHRINESCPLHGRPEQDERLRVYVGTEGDAIAQVQRAMALEIERSKLTRKRSNSRNRIRRASTLLEKFFNVLEWTVDVEGKAELSDRQW